MRIIMYGKALSAFIGKNLRMARRARFDANDYYCEDDYGDEYYNEYDEEEALK